MLKQVVNYTDPLTDENVTETLHFNLSKAELAELVMIDPEYGDKLKKIAERQDAKELIETVKQMVRESYGVVVEVGGKRQFRKSVEATEAFFASEAYSTFFFGLFTDPQNTINFVNGIMPQEFMEGVEVPQANDRPNRPQPQDRKPKQVKQSPAKLSVVELPEEDIEVEDNPAQDRLKELEAKPLDGLSLDELIELKTLRGDV